MSPAGKKALAVGRRQRSRALRFPYPSHLKSQSRRRSLVDSAAVPVRPRGPGSIVSGRQHAEQCQKPAVRRTATKERECGTVVGWRQSRILHRATILGRAWCPGAVLRPQPRTTRNHLLRSVFPPTRRKFIDSCCYMPTLPGLPPEPPSRPQPSRNTPRRNPRRHAPFLTPLVPRLRATRRGSPLEPCPARRLPGAP